MSEPQDSPNDANETDLKRSIFKKSVKKPKKTSLKFISATNLHNLKKEEIYKYVLSLHKRIKKLVKKCRKYKEKIVKLKSASYGGNQGSIQQKVKIDESNANDSLPNDTVETKSTTDFIASIKDAAHEAQNNTGFIYEPTSGLYYDSRTGYYYNAEHGLYYDGNNGCYYSFNQDENKFEFHSQVYSDATTSKANEQTDDIDRDLTKKIRKRRRSKTVDDFDNDNDWQKRENKLSDEAKYHRKNDKKKEKRSDVSSKTKINKSEKNDENREDGEISDDDDDIVDQRRDFKYKDRYKKCKDGHSIVEISDTSNSSNDSEESDKLQDVAKKYPPSIRIIVQETNIKKLKIGELFLITCKGGSLGREGTHDVIIPDINCSKYHLKFVYDETASEYKCTDLGSRNGTIMNGKRMSNAKQESNPMSLLHGTTLQIGQTKLLCHIHDGHTTCGQCEPGLLQIDDTVCIPISAETKVTNAAEEHKRQLKNIKKRYGLEDEKYIEPRVAVKNDRAAQRRQKVGSSCDAEKTKAASLETSIPSENKGFKMLSKLGWAEGQTLGKNEDGIREPIPLQANQGTMGLGCEGGLKVNAISTDNQKQKRNASIWKKAQERYQATETAAVNMFKDESDGSD